MPPIIGVDVGGTFTDFVAFDDGRVRAWKIPSTPAHPDQAVLAGLGSEAGRVVHGSTVATNALLERRGGRVVLITTEGFGDILTIRRQVRPQLYALEPRRRPHVVAPGDVIEVHERSMHAGEPILELRDTEIARVVAMASGMPDATFAVSFVHGFTWQAHEGRVADALRAAGLPVSVSHAVLPEYREYERASTTAVNAYLVAPVRGYLQRLSSALPGLRVMASDGGVVAPSHAGDLPISMVTSGPAGGVFGALAVAKAAGYQDIVTFDMGGTSTDVSICPGGEPQYRTSSEVDGLAVHTPTLDVITVGAGGGSIARLDPGGALRVGPESAGADPGPACYGRGTAPTVSDADLALGRLRPGALLAGSMNLDESRALTALGTLGDPREAAEAVIGVVNTNMARAVRSVSLQRGFDPARFTLVAFGGAGPLHACDLATEVGIGRVLVPELPGVLSALGMVTASASVEFSDGTRTRIGIDEDQFAGIAYSLAAVAGKAVAAGLSSDDWKMTWCVDARYLGQAHELRVELRESPTGHRILEAFHAAHEARFGYAMKDHPVEVVATRARLSDPAPASPVTKLQRLGAPEPVPAPITLRAAAGDLAAALYRRDTLRPGDAVSAPAIITQDDATTYVPRGWRGYVDDYGNLILEPSP
jgi:N-methylhydantoinase A